VLSDSCYLVKVFNAPWTAKSG